MANALHPALPTWLAGLQGSEVLLQGGEGGSPGLLQLRRKVDDGHGDPSPATRYSVYVGVRWPALTITVTAAALSPGTETVTSAVSGAGASLR